MAKGVAIGGLDSGTIHVTIDTSEIKKAEKLLRLKGPEAVGRAVKRSIKSGVSAFKSKEKGGAPSVYIVGARELAKTVTTFGNSFTVSSRLLTAGNKPAHFSITPKAYGRKRKSLATLKVKRNGAAGTLPHAFIANPAKINGGTTMLWERTKKYGRYGKKPRNRWMEPVRRVSAAQMLQNEKVQEPVMDAIEDTFGKRIDYELKRIGV